MTEKIHKCYEDDDGMRVRKANYYNFWTLEWNFEDENDPCYGSLIIKYCPFCGVLLEGIV